MGLCNVPDIFKNEMFNGVEYVRRHITDLLIIDNKSFLDHIIESKKV